jgi:hypothetical protein
MVSSHTADMLSSENAPPRNMTSSGPAITRKTALTSASHFATG